MCFAVIASFADEAVLATDQRLVVRGRDDSDPDIFLDIPGSRLHRLPGGWLSGLGRSGLYVRAALGELLPYSARDVDAIAHHLAELSKRNPAAFGEGTGFDFGDVAACRFLVATDAGRIAILGHDGSILAESAGSGGGGVYPAAREGGEISRDGNELRRAIRESRSVFDLIRAAAREFTAVCDETPTVSPVIEIGVGAHMITGVARRLATETDDELRRRCSPPRAPNVSAFDASWLAAQLRDYRDGLPMHCTMGHIS